MLVFVYQYLTTHWTLLERFTSPVVVVVFVVSTTKTLLPTHNIFYHFSLLFSYLCIVPTLFAHAIERSLNDFIAVTVVMNAAYVSLESHAGSGKQKRPSNASVDRRPSHLKDHRIFHSTFIATTILHPGLTTLQQLRKIDAFPGNTPDLRQLCT